MFETQMAVILIIAMFSYKKRSWLIKGAVLYWDSFYMKMFFWPCGEWGAYPHTGSYLLQNKYLEKYFGGQENAEK